MGDCRMRWKKNEADSVMAVVMNLDKLRPKQSSHEKQRVLSDAYISKTMSVGRRRESSVIRKRLSQENGDIRCKKETNAVPETPGNSGTKKDKQSKEHDFPCVDYMSVSLNSQLERIDKHCRFPYSVSSFDPNPRKKVRDVLQDSKWDCRRYREHLRPRNEEHRDTSAKHNCIACSRTMSGRSWKREELFTKFKDVWVPGNVSNNFQEIKENGSNPEANIQRVFSETSNLVSRCGSDDSFAGLEASKFGQYREVSSEEESMNGSHEGESAYKKNYKSAAPKFLDELKENYQLSPDSVLEQSDSRIQARFKHFDHQDLWKLLQSLDFEELEESFSEESEIIVSDEEDANHKFANLFEDSTEIKQWFNDHESNDYSYMVDVLEESRIFSSEPYMDFRKWHSLESPISPSLFEALETKYGGKQIFFDKNHRHLLFDRINSGLESIFDRDINFHVGAKSTKRMFFSFLRRDKVEDELWRILTCQEKAEGRDLSEKAVDERFGFDEGISIVCCELESILFEELVMEFLRVSC